MRTRSLACGLSASGWLVFAKILPLPVISRRGTVTENRQARDRLQAGARAEPFLHPLHQIGDGGTGNLQVVRRAGKTTALGDSDKNLHFLETVHMSASWSMVKANGMMIPVCWQLSLP